MNKILSKTPKLQLGKAFLTLLFGVFALFANIDATKAQTTVQVGTGTSTSNRLPIYSCYVYNYSQQIYTGAEIAAVGGNAGTISQVKFYYNSGGTNL